MGVWGSGGSEFAGYDYVQTDPPSNPSEGETWYDVDADGAFVYDGAGWVEMTVTDHGQLSGIQAGQHRSDSNIITTVDGQVDADTVDGSHASDLGAPNSTQSQGINGGYASESASGSKYLTNADGTTSYTKGTVVKVTAGAPIRYSVTNAIDSMHAYMDAEPEADWEIIALGVDYVGGGSDQVWSGSTDDVSTGSGYAAGFVQRYWAKFEKVAENDNTGDAYLDISGPRLAAVAQHSHDL